MSIVMGIYTLILSGLMLYSKLFYYPLTIATYIAWVVHNKYVYTGVVIYIDDSTNFGEGIAIRSIFSICVNSVDEYGALLHESLKNAQFFEQYIYIHCSLGKISGWKY